MTTPFAKHRVRDVEVASLQLRRIYRVIRETLRAMSAHVPSAPRHETKRLLARHAWIDALHADALRARVLELRFPRVDVDDDTPPAWTKLLSFLPRVKTSAELLGGIYQVIKPRVLAALKSFQRGADEIDDAPSHFILRRILSEIHIELQECDDEWLALPAQDRQAAQPWVDYLKACMDHLGGLEISSIKNTPADLPHQSSLSDRPEYRVPSVPVRNPAYEPAVMQVPPRPPRNDVESRIWLAIDHANEMWAAELPSALIWRYGEKKADWELIRDSTRWAYDESRHQAMGERWLVDQGFRPGIDYPVVSDHFSTLAAAGYSLEDVLLLLHALELGGPHWKSDLVREFRQLNDPLNAVDCDYDWADEAGHIRIGLAWTRLLFPDLTKQQVIAKHAKLKELWASWIAQRHADGTHWYEQFLPRIEKLAAEIARREGTGHAAPAKITYSGADVFDFDMPQDQQSQTAN